MKLTLEQEEAILIKRFVLVSIGEPDDDLEQILFNFLKEYKKLCQTQIKM